MRTSKGMVIEAIFDGQKDEWLLRLGFCSTKDATREDEMSYSLSIGTVNEAFRCVVASKRATRAMEDILLTKPPGPASLWSIPYRGCMDTSKEFRVFCPPVWSLYTLSRKRNPQQRGETSPQNQADHGQEPCRVTAISQYRWLSPYHHASLTTAEEDAEKVLAGAMSIHTQIQAYVERRNAAA